MSQISHGQVSSSQLHLDLGESSLNRGAVGSIGPFIELVSQVLMPTGLVLAGWMQRGAGRARGVAALGCPYQLFDLQLVLAALASLWQQRLNPDCTPEEHS